MKLVKALSEPFKFPYDGSVTFDITMEGTLVPDYVGEAMVNRFHVSVEDAESSEVDSKREVTAPAPGDANVATLEQMSDEGLKALAAEKGIDLGKLKARAKIIAAIAAGLEAQVKETQPAAPAPEVEPEAPVAPAPEADTTSESKPE